MESAFGLDFGRGGRKFNQCLRGDFARGPPNERLPNAGRPPAQLPYLACERTLIFWGTPEDMLKLGHAWPSGWGTIMSEKIQSGTLAPDFVGETTEGKSLKFSELRGKPVWLIFYRYAACPLCNLHLCNLFYRYESTKTDFSVVAIFESPAEEFPQGGTHPDRPTLFMIADPQKKIYEQYGTESKLLGLLHPKIIVDLIKARAEGFKQGSVDGELGQLPAHFLIGEDGKIEQAHYGKHIDDHISWEEVNQFLESRSTNSASGY
jgi:peroxiredoxin Q/BCP